MTEANVQEKCSAEVVVVRNLTSLPYTYIPYATIEHARINHPCDKLYVFEGKYPTGYKIVAFPIVMYKPKPEAEEDSDA